MTQSALSSGLPTSDHIKATLQDAQHRAHAVIEDAVDGLASAYGEAQPLLARVGRRARGYAYEGMDTMRHAGSDLRDRGMKAVDSTRGYIKDEPFKSLLIAAAVGATVIALVELVRVRRR